MPSSNRKYLWSRPENKGVLNTSCYSIFANPYLKMIKMPTLANQLCKSTLQNALCLSRDIYLEFLAFNTQ